MLARVPHPYTVDMAEAWIASHHGSRQRGEEHVFCIEVDGEVAGSVGLRRMRDGVYDLGYWLGEAWWGRGLATEAATRIVRFAFEDLDATGLVSGHFADNPASGRVLEKCGLRYIGDSMQYSEARGGTVAHRDFELRRASWTGRAEAS